MQSLQHACIVRIGTWDDLMVNVLTCSWTGYFLLKTTSSLIPYWQQALSTHSIFNLHRSDRLMEGAFLTRTNNCISSDVHMKKGTLDALRCSASGAHGYKKPARNERPEPLKRRHETARTSPSDHLGIVSNSVFDFQSHWPEVLKLVKVAGYFIIRSISLMTMFGRFFSCSCASWAFSI